MRAYTVIDAMAELPCGSHFIVVPSTKETGALALFGVGYPPHERLIIGRWFPSDGEYDWIWQPSQIIRIAKDVILWIIGRIVPL
jgi:hypothetical protein